MFSSKTLSPWLSPLILVCSLFTTYLYTLAPGLTWANDGSDGGDLITAAATGGIPHPTGYPLYLLVGRLFQFLPFRSLAFRTNLLSALATALAAVLIYFIVMHSLDLSKFLYQPVGMAAAYAFGLSPLIWSQAVITEVYGLQAILMALIIYLYTAPPDILLSNCRNLDRCRGLLLGLAMANHITAIFIVPVALLLGSVYIRPKMDIPSFQQWHSWFGGLKIDRSRLLRQLGMLGVGFSLYLLIPLRALNDPPVNWGNAVTLERLWWLVSGQLYQNYYLQITPSEYWERVQTWAVVLLQEFGLVGVLLGLVGLVVFGRLSRLYILTAWTAIIYTSFAAFYKSADSYVYIMPMFLSFTIWIGLGIGGVVKQSLQRSLILGTSLGLLLIAYFIGRAAMHMSDVDASRDYRAEAFASEVFYVAPKHALVFAKGDQAVFSLWYFHYALGERPDLAVVATDLLHFDWYQENLRSNYPMLNVPGSFPWPATIAYANPGRAVCYVQYSDQAEVNCSGP